ncbi:MAG: TRAP transporter small permease subunit, partial [Burkholderiales bacterium]|nr:TRAP transporter small permease subunit [Burkholderiales bacterium]
MLKTLNNVLNHLEEWLIATLIALATTIVFVAVLHRYGTSNSIDFAKWLDAHGMAYASPPFRAIFKWLASLDLSWAQELCIYLFIWMAKFGAAYGVRTGIHVGVDVLVMRMEPARAKKVILFGLLSGALFTAVIANFGAHFTWSVWQSGTRSNDLEIRMWIVYLAIP